MYIAIPCPECAGSGKCPGCHKLPGMAHDPKSCAECIDYATFLRQSEIGALADGTCPHACEGGLCGMCGGTGVVYD